MRCAGITNVSVDSISLKRSLATRVIARNTAISRGNRMYQFAPTRFHPIA